MDLLFQKAKEVSEKSYSPYSHFKVGSALKAASGTIYIGTNVENASYSLAQCAEGAAITAMVAGGDREISEILVYCDSGNVDLLCTPCGACRQKIREFATPQTKIYLSTKNGVQKTVTIEDLLPLSFGPENL
ncbi:MAG: cytidine deaminase [Alphaproteobacteria bacterium]|nr:cytidine deaminase [Alphaproteobacteria bacterium]MBP9877119.1 cytidine deaminase [Alphaproteobacteria bacterium]